ncbi:putative Lycopene epsilon cyclase, chloroplast precursor [Hibiscus syriacus]|uniref:MYB transcription factor n=1 Tax=Hibiscus syriacus TaxID=106335 RepID=A0A6A2Z6S0_HIBSY|nr:telomere repeat-binding factor 4-like [Hibiscus syriacus]KAE8687558.1 putative Lycopene epsilon cyclase, chloroplast precursor [Hibiscus syriacus]
MGNPKQKWTAEEEEALRAGVAKYGKGNWKLIQRDPELSPFLFARSNIDLKDKWRNLSGGPGGHGSREKSRTSKPKPNSAGPQSSVVVKQTALPKPLIDDSSRSFAPSPNRYNELIIEAVSALKEPNGSDNRAIVGYIEQRQEVPQSFKKQLCSRLKRLVALEKLEKVHNRYKIRKYETFGTKSPIPKQKGKQPKQLQDTGRIICDAVEEASVTAAYLIAEAENKSFLAAEAVKEAERVSKMAEDTDSLLQLAKEIFETCSQGEIVLIV